MNGFNIWKYILAAIWEVAIIDNVRSTNQAILITTENKVIPMTRRSLDSKSTIYNMKSPMEFIKRNSSSGENLILKAQNELKDAADKMFKRSITHKAQRQPSIFANKKLKSLESIDSSNENAPRLSAFRRLKTEQIFFKGTELNGPDKKIKSLRRAGTDFPKSILNKDIVKKPGSDEEEIEEGSEVRCVNLEKFEYGVVPKKRRKSVLKRISISDSVGTETDSFARTGGRSI